MFHISSLLIKPYLKIIIFFLFCSLTMQLVFAVQSYELEASVNDEKFIINGEKYDAKTYCFNMQEGDQIVFMEGSPFGACASATLFNKRTQNTCEVWCE